MAGRGGKVMHSIAAQTTLTSFTGNHSLCFRLPRLHKLRGGCWHPDLPSCDAASLGLKSCPTCRRLHTFSDACSKLEASQRHQNASSYQGNCNWGSCICRWQQPEQCPTSNPCHNKQKTIRVSPTLLLLIEACLFACWWPLHCCGRWLIALSHLRVATWLVVSSAMLQSVGTC